MSHVMTHPLHSSSPDQLEQLLATAGGRFGRQVRTIACPDPEMAPVRSATVARLRARTTAGEYRIDPAAVADAIVERVYPGGRATPRLAQAS